MDHSEGGSSPATVLLLSPDFPPVSINPDYAMLRCSKMTITDIHALPESGHSVQFKLLTQAGLPFYSSRFITSVR